MSDLISRQDAIEVVQNRHMMLSKEKVLLINDLEELPSAQPHWIPTSERLPKISEDVLLSHFDEVTIGWLNSDGSLSIFDGQECVNADEVSAWMPLPEPYKPSVIEKCLGENCHE